MQIRQKMFYLLACVHIYSTRTYEILWITILPLLFQRSQHSTQHKCFLQPITHEKKKKRKNEKEQHTVFGYFDIEAQQGTGNHIANLVCAETDQNDTQFTFQGKDCIQQFLHWVHTLVNQEDIEKVIVVAHNFKSYDGYFILEELYKQHARHQPTTNHQWSQDSQFRITQCQVH